jgi:outer membrane protein OmpA-like peptidoglycan-associated protein
LGKTGVERQEEELQKQMAAEEQQRKDAEMKAAEEKTRQELAAKKAAEEKRLKEEEAQKALEAKKAEEAKKAAEPVVAPKPEQPKEVKKEIVFESIYFETNSSELAPSERAKLDAAAKMLQENPDVNVEISGNTDITGSRSLNEKLASARANVVKNYLIRKGASRERLTAKGYAFDKPVAPNTTVEGRQLNRRTESQVVK